MRPGLRAGTQSGPRNRSGAPIGPVRKPLSPPRRHHLVALFFRLVVDEFRRVRDDGRFAGFVLYETAGFLRLTAEEGCDVTEDAVSGLHDATGAG